MLANAILYPSIQSRVSFQRFVLKAGQVGRLSIVLEIASKEINSSISIAHRYMTVNKEIRRCAASYESRMRKVPAKYMVTRTSRNTQRTTRQTMLL